MSYNVDLILSKNAKTPGPIILLGNDYLIYGALIFSDIILYVVPLLFAVRPLITSILLLSN